MDTVGVGSDQVTKAAVNTANQKQLPAAVQLKKQLEAVIQSRKQLEAAKAANASSATPEHNGEAAPIPSTSRGLAAVGSNRHSC